MVAPTGSSMCLFARTERCGFDTRSLLPVLADIESMDFVVQGRCTPRTGQRPLSGRPTSARPTVSRNPITGEERDIGKQEVENGANMFDTKRPQSRPDDVPSLNLNYLRDQGEPIPTALQDVYDISLDTGRSVSTVSWGTARSSRISNRSDTRTPRASNSSLVFKFQQSLNFNSSESYMNFAMPVISDPGQDTRTPYGDYDQKRGRGSNRFMHESKIRTRTTATENLLSKRVRFGVRVVTRDGHDALRELTGFFFHIDNTFTVYEFRQFGKNAKALPFVVRGRYCHLCGHRKGQPYLLTDITPGYDLRIDTASQISLPDTLKKKPILTLRVTDVDEAEKQDLLVGDVPLTQRGKAYEDLHINSKLEHQDRLIVHAVQSEVRKQLKKRAIRTITGLGRYYRSIDPSREGILYRFELEKGLFDYHIELSPEKLDLIFEILDPDECGELEYDVYMHGVMGEMSEYRKSLVRKAFQKIDAGKKGLTTISDIKKFFNATFKTSQSANLDASPLKAFLDAVLGSSGQKELLYLEFEEYYEGCSLGIEDDEEFKNILRNTWTI
ncbi:hypothetical protein ScPMuIL_013430 [Solemya velum]